MRFTIFILLISVSQVLAVNGYSQQAKLSLHLKNVKVEKVLDEIETQTEYKFLYNKETVDVDRKVDVSISDKTVNAVLNDLFETTSVSFAIFDRQILLSKKNVIQAAQQKERVVTGVVTDENGEALPGVSVVVKGTTNGITTDIDGKYTLKVPANSILQFSFVGMKTQEVVVDKNKLNVVLEEDAIGLDEVVAVGYGTKSRTSVTGAVDVAKSEVLNRKVNTDAMSAIQGALPGVRLTRASGQTGYNQYKIDIRGASSLNGAQPLVIIDGVPSGYRELELMNPNDIESVTSLKDAAAAIYGARAANGVLLVTTKKGKGKMSVSLTNSLTFSKAALMPVKTTTRQHVEMFNEAYTNDGQATNPFTKYLDYGPYTNKLVEGPFGDTPLILWGDNNWKDALFGTGSIQTHNLSIRGSDEKHSYAVSLGYINEDSMLKFGKNNMKRYNVRLNETYNVSKDLKLNLNIGFGSKNVIEPSELGGAFGQLSKAWSSHPVYNEVGGFYNFGGFRNPAAVMELAGELESRYKNITLNLGFEYSLHKLISGLKVTGSYGLNYNSLVARGYRKYWESSPDGKAIQTNNTTNRAWNNHSEDQLENYQLRLDYSRIFSDVHDINLMVGASQEEYIIQKFDARRELLSSDELHTLNLGDTGRQYNNGTATHNALRSFYGRAGYIYDRKYALTAIFRRDGSSRFIEDDRYKNFFGLSGAWTLSQEQFIKNLGVFDNLKLRLSYGETGNQGGIGNYDYIQLIKLRNNLYPFGESASKTNFSELGGMVSLTRTWEKVKSKNIGVDFAVLNNKLSGTFDYFIKNNDNMLLGRTYPSVLGAVAPAQNIAKLENKGFELSLKWKDKLGNLSYWVSGHVSNYKAFINDKQGDNVKGFGTKTIEGYAMRTIFGYKSMGIIQNEEQLAEYKKLENVPGDIRVGDMMYADIDGNGKIESFSEDGGDLVDLGDAQAHYLFTFRLGAEYKNFDFSATFTGVGDRKVLLSKWRAPMFPWYFQPDGMFYGNTWSPERPNARFAALTASHLRNWNYLESDNMMYNARYVRLNDLQLGYTLTDKALPILSKAGISKVRMYLNGRDLWEWAPDIPEGYDPERGLDFGWYPFSRYFGFGLDVTF